VIEGTAAPAIVGWKTAHQQSVERGSWRERPRDGAGGGHGWPSATRHRRGTRSRPSAVLSGLRGVLPGLEREASGTPLHPVVIDARSSEAYRREHIPGAISLPHRGMSAEATRHLDRAALLVGGLDWWKRDGHPTHGQLLAPARAACGCEGDA